MQYPDNYNLTSDFASFATDSSGNSISITISSGSRVPTSSPRWDAFATGGSAQSFIRARMISSKDNKWGSGTTLISMVNVSIMQGSSVLATMNQPMFCILDKIDNTSVRLRIFLEGFSGYEYRVNETITVQAIYSSFINPLL